VEGKAEAKGKCEHVGEEEDLKDADDKFTSRDVNFSKLQKVANI